MTFDAQGRTWRVRRRWLPWRRRVRDVPSGPDMPDLGDDPISMLLGALLLVLLIPVFVVLVVLVLELALLLVLLPVFLLLRAVAPVPWTIEVLQRPTERRWLGWHVQREARVAGWAASREEIETIAARVRDGGPPEGHAVALTR